MEPPDGHSIVVSDARSLIEGIVVPHTPVKRFVALPTFCHYPHADPPFVSTNRRECWSELPNFL